MWISSLKVSSKLLREEWKIHRRNWRELKEPSGWMFVEAIAMRHEAQSLQPLLQNQGCKAFTRRAETRDHGGGAALSSCRVETRDWKKQDEKKKRRNDGENGRPSLDRNKITENSHRGGEPVVGRALKILLHVVGLITDDFSFNDRCINDSLSESCATRA